MPPRRLDPDARRRELLDAAVRVLRRRGPVGSRVEDITTEAGTAKGNFYRYFPTWDHLLIAVRDHLVDEYGDGVRQRLAARDRIDWADALGDEVDRFVDYQVGLDGLHDAVFHGPASRTRPIDNERSAVSVIAAFLRAGIADGVFDEVDVDATAPLLFHLIHGASDEIRAGADRDETLRATRHVIRRALARNTKETHRDRN